MSHPHREYNNIKKWTSILFALEFIHFIMFVVLFGYCVHYSLIINNTTTELHSVLQELQHLYNEFNPKTNLIVHIINRINHTMNTVDDIPQLLYQLNKYTTNITHYIDWSTHCLATSICN